MRALVLSGGGSKGQYHVGALRALLTDFVRHYDIVCGVSVGALIVALLAQHPLGAEKKAYQHLETVFTAVQTRHIWKPWFPFGKLHGLWKGGLVDASPLRGLISKHFDPAKVRTSGRKLRIGAVSLSDGTYRVWTEEDVPLDRIIYASAAYPMMFEPIRIRGQWWIDGGIREVTPVKAAIDAGAESIDIVMCSPKEQVSTFSAEPNALDIALRSVDLMLDEIIAGDVEQALLYNRLVAHHDLSVIGKRHVDFRVIRPELPLLDDPLQFHPKEARVLQAIGYRDAHLALA